MVIVCGTPKGVPHINCSAAFSAFWLDLRRALRYTAVMRYVVSDIHGEYGLFCRLLDKIKFSAADELFVCGDMTDKGQESVKLLQCLSAMPNARCLLGNHEYAFLKYYHSLFRTCRSEEEVLAKLRTYFPQPDGLRLEERDVEWLESLPFFIEEEEFICVHAGVPLDGSGRIIPPRKVRAEYLMNDRTFMRAETVPKDSKCVFFGHTPTRNICNRDMILAYVRDGRVGDRIQDYYKIHLDTGVWMGGILGCFCVDACDSVYV